MADLLTVAEARDFDGVVRALSDLFGDDATLFAIDHAFDRLVEVCADPSASASYPLDDDLRLAMLENRPQVVDDVRWFPISDREQPVLVVRTDASAPPPSEQLVTLLGPIANGHRHRFEELERVRRRTEMSVAAEMQWAALPNRADLLGEYAIGSVLEPAYEVAGDAFDYAASDGAVWAYSLDGMGHGVAATMASVLALSAIRNARRTGHGLDEQMNRASAALFAEFDGGCFVTALGCRIDADGVQFVNAGHEPAWRVTGGTVSRLDLHAELPLGVVGDHAYEVQTRPTLGRGDGVALFSDGPSNARSPAGSLYGSDRLRDRIEAHWSETPLRTAHDVIGDVLSYIDGGRVTDDITAVVIHRRTGRGGA
ncbi:PP2C family protein-serine/threonine phosphatase [Ilumatobacter nonamiensis]|uniref:PP2C family protein-serine/threonine phosphatase n=1 Tax=Ilumatobacter nonamiensis TaxID=467093 RepID=UPI000349881A|nr:PP2C family protein-serine/threonine phosphatase [Ilumatobacter nonamiensis]